MKPRAGQERRAAVRRAAVGIALMTAAGCVPGTAAVSAEVRDTAALENALKSASPGEVIHLGAGDYAPLIRDFHGAVTITSADRARPAVFTSLTVQGSSGLTIEGVVFDTEHFPPKSYGAAGTVPFQALDSSNISFRSLDVHGSPQGTLETDESGIEVRNSRHVIIEDSNFHHLHFGILHVDDNFLTIKGNDFHELRDDSIRGGGSSNVLIEGNHCHNNHPDGDRDQDHPDCIQFWTTNTTESAHDITVIGNRYEREHGHAVQFIFFGNEKHIPYEHLVIRDNVAIGSLWRGISVTDARDVTIENNRVVTMCAPESGQTNTAWIATKNVAGLTIRNNEAGAYLKQGGDTAVTESHNTTNKGCVR